MLTPEILRSNKPDIRFGMKIQEITDKVKGHNFVVFDSAPISEE